MSTTADNPTNNDFPGRGKRKPQINLPLELIFLDTENPRLAKQRDAIEELDILRTLYEEYDLEELAMSMSANGYFDEEPIIVVPRTFPADFVYDETKSPDEIQEELRSLIDQGLIDFVVVEGNRRIGTCKLLTDEARRTALEINNSFFETPANPAIIDDLKTIPAIVYGNRDRVSPYLGVRHISGLLKWDAFAKAAYIAQNIENGVTAGQLTYAQSIAKLRALIPDRTDAIRKQYLCYRVIAEAEIKLGFDTSEIKDRFSLLTLAINSPSIRSYAGIPSYKEANFDEDIIPPDHTNKLRHVLTWIYGHGDTDPILTDSRLITSRLAPVLASTIATEYLLANNNLNDAYERSDGDKEYILKKLANAAREVRFAAQDDYVNRFKSDQLFLDAIEVVTGLIAELNAKANA